MDPTLIKKIQAMNRYKRRQFLDNLYFYSFTTLTCILFCCVPLFLLDLSSLATDFFFVCIPSFWSVLFSSKFLFILGNLIIVVLIVNSRVFSSKSSSSTTDVYYHEYIKTKVSRQTQRPQAPTFEVIKARSMEEHVAEYVDMTGEKVEKENLEEEEEEGEPSLASDSDELNKRADAFIARVNKQMKLELSLLQCGSY